MAAASIPALLVLCHRIAKPIEQPSSARVLLPVIALAVISYVCAVHSMLTSLPAAWTVIMVYVWIVFGASWAFLRISLSLALGLLLYSPFLWAVCDAVRLSPRFIGDDFLQYHQGLVNPSEWILNAKLVFSQIAVGHNQYGIYVGTVVGVVAWLCLGQTWRQESAQIRRVLRFLSISIPAFLAFTIFDHSIDYLKLKLPLVGAWHIRRFEHLLFFPILAVFAWMLDCSVFRVRAKALGFRQIAVFRTALFVVGGIAALQIGYSAVRMRLVPAFIFPQDLILYVYLFLYAATTVCAFVALYRAARLACATQKLLDIKRTHSWAMAWVVISASLVTSVHAYRAGVLPPKTGLAARADPIMTYAQRYSVPNDIRTIKELNKSDGRVVDLSRPWYADTLGPASETTLLPLGGLRTPSGYNVAIARWYDQFVNFGINGRPRITSHIVQIGNSPETNFEALGLLDVQYILAKQGSLLAGYHPILQFPESGKALYGPQDPTLVSPAFLSTGLRCFQTDGEALHYIHGTGLRQLKAEAVLVASDPEARALCAQRDQRDWFGRAGTVRIETSREPDRVRVEVESDGGGLLTLSDSYYPGWKVYVDRNERPILRTYTTLRGVALESGRHLVEFVYTPRAFNLLYWLSNGLLLILFLVGIVAWGMDRVQLRTQRTRYI